MKTEINQLNKRTTNHSQIINSLKKLYSYQNPHLEIKLARNTEELQQAKKLRQKVYNSYQPGLASAQNSKKNYLSPMKCIEQQQAIAYDGYDSIAEHLIVIDHKHNKVVAYVRLIDSFAAYKIGTYYSESLFNLKRVFNNNTFYLEVSRMVIDHDYYSREIGQLIWLGINNYSRDNGVDVLMGTFSLPLIQRSETFSFIQHLKEKHISSKRYRVMPYQHFPDSSNSDYQSTQPLMEYFFQQGCQLCGDAHWNIDFNCAEIFFIYPGNCHTDLTKLQ